MRLVLGDVGHIALLHGFSTIGLLKDQHITLKELLPIVIAIAIWGTEWVNRSILCRCDNEAVYSPHNKLWYE